MTRYKYGSVEVKVGDETYTLEPSLKAMDKIEARWPNGGIRSAIEAVGSGGGARDIAAIIAAGANVGQREAKDLPDAVFAEGAVLLAPKVIEYLILLMNPTGREPGEEAPKSGE